MFNQLSSFIGNCIKFFFPNTNQQVRYLHEHYNCYKYFIEIGCTYKESLLHHSVELPELKNSRIIHQLTQVCENSAVKRGPIASSLGIKANKLPEYLEEELHRAIELETELHSGNNLHLLEYASQAEQIKIMVTEGVYSPGFALACSIQHGLRDAISCTAAIYFANQIATNGMGSTNLAMLFAGLYVSYISTIYCLQWLSHGAFNILSWHYDLAEIREETQVRLEHLKLIYSVEESTNLHEFKPYGTDEEMQMDEYTPTIGDLGWVF